MYISPVNVNRIENVKFGHKPESNSYSTRERAIVAGTTALGVGTALAILAKRAGYSLNPKKMFNIKNIENSYMGKVFYEDKQVIPMGIGTSLGGLAGGYLIDKDPANRKAKRREAVMQVGNISIPILTVAQFHKFGKKYGDKAAAVASVAGIFVGVYLANFLMNKLSNVIFHNKSDARGVKTTDFSAHLDDVVVAAGYINSKSKFVHCIGRIVPLALCIPGYEVGTKQAK